MKSDMVKPFVIGMLALQVITVALLWLLDAFSVQATAAFAFLLAGNVTAFAVVVHVYRTANDDIKGDEGPAPATLPATAPTAQAIGIPPDHEDRAAYGAALPRFVHIGVPLASAIVLLVFALTISLPANKVSLPVQSTVLFIPIYIAIVIVLVFASMYLFKAVMEKDVPASAGNDHAPGVQVAGLEPARPAHSD